MQDSAFQDKLKIMLGEKVVRSAVEKAKQSLDDSGTSFTVESFKQKLEENLLKQKSIPSIPEEVVLADIPQFSEEKKANFLEKLDNMHLPESRKEAIELSNDPSMREELKALLQDSSFQKKFHELHQLPDLNKLKKDLLKMPIFKSISEQNKE